MPILQNTPTLRLVWDNRADFATVTSSAATAPGLGVANLKTDIRSQICRVLSNTTTFEVVLDKKQTIGSASSNAGNAGERLELGNSVAGYSTSNLTFYDSGGGYNMVISTRGSLFRPPTGFVLGVTGSVRVYNNSSYNGLELEQSRRSPLVFLSPSTSVPPPVSGGVFMHSTHGLCISDGSGWRKTALEALLVV